MCIIMVKEIGKEFPEKKIIENMWENNPHGAGIAIAMNGAVWIEKGFLNKNAFIDVIEAIRENAKNFGIILHFRIATHGGINAECTHPFPITRDVKNLQATQVKTNLAVAHNGIIDIPTPREKMSDTMEYISTVLSNMRGKDEEFYKNKRNLKTIEKGIGTSKMAFLDAEGKITRVGDWVEENGIYYSNYTFEDWSLWDYSQFKTPLSEKCPEKRFTLSNGYMADKDGNYRIDKMDYPLLLDANNKLYEYDERYDICFSYSGKVFLFEGDELGKFDPDNCVVIPYLDLGTGKSKKKKNKSKKKKEVI